MKIIDLMPGVKVLQHGEFSILFGCPPDIIKVIMQKKIAFPDYVVLPDKQFFKGVVQNATEFVFYYHVFVLQGGGKHNKLTILGEQGDVANNQDLLKLCLNGPTLEDYELLDPKGVSPYYLDNYKEAHALSPVDENGKELPIESLVNFISFTSGVLQTDKFQLKHCDQNVYELDGTVIDINFSEEQLPPYDLRSNLVPLTPSKFGIDVLGGASGFIPTKPCSGLVLNYYGQYMLIDCMPYMEKSLKARGISRNQIKSLFLSHTHDDHCNMLPLVLFHERVQCLTTKEIFWMACKKLSLMTNHTWEEFYSYFDFVPLEPYTENDFYGMKITPHYTVHSIPCIGATFTMKCSNQEKSIVFVGDNKALPEIKEMVDTGTVPLKKYENLLKLYRDPYDLFIADGGRGILHGDPKDSLQSKSDRVVFMHMDKLPAMFNATFTSAVHGKRFTLEDGNDETYLLQAMYLLDRHYHGVPEKWMNALLHNMKVLHFNAGDVIMKQGEASNCNSYIIFSGNVNVSSHDGKKSSFLAVNQAGDLVGEMAAINQVEFRSASLIAGTPVILGEIDGNTLKTFLASENKIDSISKSLDIRILLEKLFYNYGVSVTGNQIIAEAAEMLEVKAGQVVIHQGETDKDFYIILSGKFSVQKDGQEIAHLGRRDMFGEFGCFDDLIRTATVTAKENGQVLKFTKEDIVTIIRDIPALHFFVNQLIKDRGGDFLAVPS